MHYTCIVCLTIDSVMRINKKLFAGLFRRVQIQSKKMQMYRFLNAKLESDSESDLEAESKSDTELMAKLESNSDSE